METVEGVGTGKNTSKRKYLKAKKKARRTVYQAKYKVERKRFVKLMWRGYQKCDVSKTVKRMFKTNQDIIGD